MKGARLLGQYSDFGVEHLATTVPGWKPASSKLERWDARDFPVFGLPDRVMVELYEQIAKPRVAYIADVWDCENIAKWAAVHVAELWARLVARGEVDPGVLYQGVVLGSIPVPNDAPFGNHGANFFFNDRNQYRIFEFQTMRLLSEEEVARSQAVWRLQLE